MSTRSPCLTPSRDKTVLTVRTRIVMSMCRSWLSTYSMSKANFSSQVIALRPLICANPVIPGLTVWRRACSDV